MKEFYLKRIQPLAKASFSEAYWEANQAIVGTSGGRHQVWFVQAPEQEKTWVLRHYYRGGVPSRLIKKTFCFNGLKNTRSFKEYRLLNKMTAFGLPVPKAVAAYVKTNKFTYQASILIERIPGAEDLGRYLLKQPLTLKDWVRLGHLLRAFHDKKIIHTDLNCKNILYQKNTGLFYLIDFDRCYQSHLNSNSRRLQYLKNSNLKRLKRSFIKEQGKAESTGLDFHWEPLTAWQALREGYQG